MRVPPPEVAPGDWRHADEDSEQARARAADARAKELEAKLAQLSGKPRDRHAQAIAPRAHDVTLRRALRVIAEDAYGIRLSDRTLQRGSSRASRARRTSTAPTTAGAHAPVRAILSPQLRLRGFVGGKNRWYQLGTGSNV